ncbi:ricin-type beta-trefoil lectin domain protein [Parendozoicomonas haliclonae]|uniref:Development-specific protein S n=1 Tax=Parendozoicomonas haliclonae TaxID=1960125 RepID=A0A1X7AIM5_9GAMM|nr:ricin-type beta-trefoil lectin domain protein [Parendozoicomonas haliclonae]SMA45418.1 Development-specific protein S [Parendozoicomonas haliclonae]
MKKSLTLVAALSATSLVNAAGMTTHLNMSKDALEQLPAGELKNVITDYERFMLTGTVYPDFGQAIKVLPGREAYGHFGRTHGAGFHRPYFDHINQKYDVANCYAAGDAECLKAVGNYMGILAHSIQDSTWDIMMMRKGFLKEYWSDDLWVGDLDTGGDVAMWKAGKHFTFSYTAPYPDLIETYQKLGVETDAAYLGDGLRAHNIALTFEPAKFIAENSYDDYMSYAPWYMKNMMTDSIGLPLYGEITASIWQEMWKAFISPEGLGAINPVMLSWPAEGQSHDADAHLVMVMNRTFTGLNGENVFVTDATGQKVAGHVRASDYYVAFFPDQPLVTGQSYAFTMTTGVQKNEGGPLLKEDHSVRFTAGEKAGYWRLNNQRTKIGQTGRPIEQDFGPDYFALKDQRSGLCVSVKDGVMNDKQNVELAACSEQRHDQKWYLRASETAGHTRGAKLVNKKNDGFCLDLSEGNASNGGNVQIFTCQNKHNMRWGLDEEGFVRSRHNYSLVMDANGNYPGANLTVWQQHGGANQRFERVFDQYKWFQLKEQQGGQCLTVDGSGNTVLSECSSTNSQKWMRDGEGRIHSRNNWFTCLDVEGGSSAENANVMLHSCHKNANQAWSFMGNSIRSRMDSQKALQVTNGNATIGEFRGDSYQLWSVVYENGDVAVPENGDFACFYEHSNFQGKAFCTSESVDWLNHFNDRISSFRLYGDLTAILYSDRDFNGREIKVMDDAIEMDQLNDSVSSIRIESRTSDRYACAYEHPDYKGTPLCAEAGQAYRNMGWYGLNDTTTSMKLSGGARAVIYKDYDFRRSSRTVTESEPFLSSMNDDVSSFRVE